MLYEASVSRAFSASHSILLPAGAPEPAAVVIDFLEVQRALGAVARELQGTSLNALPFFADGRCSAERLAEYLCGELARRLGGHRPWRVSVTEAPGCLAAFYPEEKAEN
jgi:6-pyruvoyl-tetrahydropterin synthase